MGDVDDVLGLAAKANFGSGAPLGEEAVGVRLVDDGDELEAGGIEDEAEFGAFDEEAADGFADVRRDKGSGLTGADDEVG